MKQTNQNQSVGVWIDHEKAILISQSPQSEERELAILQTISGDTHHSGGGGEHAMNNAKRSDALKYFKEVAQQLLNYDNILIFGPGKSQEQFLHHLQEDAHFSDKQISIEASEHVSEPQMIAVVREFFKSR